MNKVGSFAKFNTPIVANGKVYESTFSNKLNAYGIFNTPIIPVNINQEYIKSKFTIYPNPAHENIQLNFYLSKNESNIVINIFDLFGRLVITNQLNGNTGENTFSINLGNQLQSGIYIIKIQTNDDVIESSRFVKF